MADTYDPQEDNEPRTHRVAAAGALSDSEAFGQIVRDHRERVLTFAARMLGGNMGAAQDVTQETFLRLWRQRSSYREQGTLHAYLLRIACNLCLDALRSRQPEIDLGSCVEAAAVGPEVVEAVVAASLSEAIREAVYRLPAGQRAVFTLSQYEQLSYREISEALNCPIGTVASRKYLAVVTLRRSLRDWMPEKV